MGNTVNYYLHPDEVPYDESPLQFDPLYGFPEGTRKKKEQPVSYAELESMQVPPEFRNFCVHKIIAYRTCFFENFPFVHRCKPYLHDYHNCQNEEMKDQMKDYERERRLLKRRKRILQKQMEIREMKQAT